MTIAPLEQFRAEMQALAAKIDMAEERLPVCGRDGRSGWSVDISDESAEYVYSASERGVPYELTRSRDRAKVMEAVFVDLTERMAREVVGDRYPAATPWRRLLGPFGQPIALKQQREIQILQEQLLSRIDEAWCYRASVENALWLRRAVDFYFRIQ